VPNIVHCHGWFTGLVPLYVKKAFREDPLFSRSKVVYSIYSEKFDGLFSQNFKTKALIDGVSKKDVVSLADANYAAINKLAINYSDGFVLVGNDFHPEITESLKLSKKPVIQHHPDSYIKDYSAFYDKILK
jgi:starch synthase